MNGRPAFFLRPVPRQGAPGEIASRYETQNCVLAGFTDSRL